MKTRPLSNQRGIALVVVLVFLVLLSIFIVGFFSNSQDELTAAQSFTGEVSASHLAESAVSVVMGQVREATGRKNGAWGSQPGMIRVYRDGDTASDRADAFFKLYSSDDMVVSGGEIGSFDPAKEVAEGAGTGWEHVPALWTNLNEEVKVPVPNSDRSVDRYPILDPSLDRQVEGLEFIEVANAEASSKIKKARMPVKWLYVLKDGTLTSPSSSGGNGTKAIWKQGEREPTRANPIVGRVAFWTDDESCKVNINTAGGYSLKPEDSKSDGGMPKADARGNAIGEDDYAGSFWDTPRAFTVFDRGMTDNDGVRTGALGSYKYPDGTLDRGGLGLSQPVRGEFQRYPGHPSTTSLGIVFRGRPPNGGTSMQDAPYLLKSGQLALLAPRLMFSLTNKNQRASNYGTDRLLAADYRSDPDLQSNDQPVGFRIKRLYASVDELFYAQPDKPLTDQRKQNDWELGVSGVSQNDTAKILTADYLEKMRFFLTAHSRSPELNLFGQPRVTIWPVWRVKKPADEADVWNASDRLIAYCSTIGPDATRLANDEDRVRRYLFQRQDAYTPNIDIELKRNQEILAYLRRVTSKPFPGIGGQSFEEKYRGSQFGNDRYGNEQILTEIFDYIRTVNLRDSTRDKTFNEQYPMVNNAWPKANVVAKEKYKYAPRGLVVPAVSTANGKANARHGFGRFPTISEATIVLYVSGFVGTDGKRYLNSRATTFDRYPTVRYVVDRNGSFVPPTGPPANRVKVRDTLVRAFFVAETFNPMQGYAPTTTPNGNSPERRAIIMEIENLNEFKLDGKPLAMPQLAENPIAYSSGSFWGGRNSGGSEGFMHTLWAWPNSRPKAGVSPNASDSTPNQSPGDTVANPVPWYPFQTNTLDASVADPNPLTSIPGIPFPYELSPGVIKKTAVLEGPKELKVRMYYGSVNVKPAVRDITLDFSGPGQVTVPMPTDLLWSIPDFRAGYEGVYAARTSPGPSALGGNYGVGLNVRGGFVEDPLDHPNRGAHALWSCNMPITINSISWLPQDRSAKSLGDWIDPGEPDSTKRIKPGRLTWIQNDSGNHSGDKVPGPDYERRWQQIFQPGDVVRSVVYGDIQTGLGDLRKSCISVSNTDASTVFSKHPEYGHLNASTDIRALQRHAQTLRMADAQLYFPDRDPENDAASTAITETRFGQIVRLPTNRVYPAAQSSDLPYGMKGVKRSGDKLAGDFDTGIGNLADGPFCGKADEGNLAFRHANNNSAGQFEYWDYPIPYFTWTYEDTFETFFSPNRQAPSPVVFGSLLSGKSVDWQTLCFSPNPAGANHPGIDPKLGPKDYLWLDLFNMPVVEPYAISEPFSTAGKINLNYPIIPFTHIKRTTGLRAALQPVRVTGFPIADVIGANGTQLSYKTGSPAGTPLTVNYRYLVDRDETIKGFDAYFNQYTNDHSMGFIKAGAQICDFYLYPRQKGKPLVSWVQNDTKIKQWWAANTLTGDNVREKPYADLYPRITTKSNTFCVHIRAQSLRQSAPSDPATAAEFYRTWDEKRDRIVGEYRGSSIIERYIDPQDERFDPNSQNKDVTGLNPDSVSIDAAYRFRVLNTKRFDP